MVKTPPCIKAILDDKYPLPPSLVDNIIDTPPQSTVEERQSLINLLLARRRAKNRLLKRHEHRNNRNMETNNETNNNDNYPVTPHQPTAAEEALTTLRTMMAGRQGTHANAAAQVAREAASAAAAAAMQGLATINQQELAALTPAINKLANTVAQESARRTGENQRRRSEAAAVASPTANMTNPVASPTIDTEMSIPEDDPSPNAAPMDAPKSILKSSTDDTEEEEIGGTPRRTIFERISSTLSFSSSKSKKRKGRISFGGGNNDEVKEYVKEYTIESPIKQEDDVGHVVVYDRSLYEMWARKTDEQFLEDFTLQLVDGAASLDDASIIIKQILFVADAKHLLRDVPIQVLRAANRLAWPKEKKFFINLSPVRRQIKSRLAKSYKIVHEYNMAKEKEQAEEQVNQEQLTDVDVSEMDATEMEA